MHCPVCMINRVLKKDIDLIKTEGMCSTCLDIEKYFTDDKTITEEEAKAEGLSIVDENWFSKEQEV